MKTNKETGKNKDTIKAFNPDKQNDNKIKKDKKIPDIVSYNTLIMKSPDYDSARKILKEMKKSGVSPNEISYNSLMYKSANYETAIKVFDELKNAGLNPSEVTYTTLINKADNYQDALSIFYEMKSIGLSPNLFTYNSLMDKTVTYGQAIEVLTELKNENIEPNLCTYTTLFSKDTKSESVYDIHKWYLKEKVHISSALEPLIKNLFNKQKITDAYYLILNYPHFGVSQKIMTQNATLTFSQFEYFKGKSFYDNNIDYALGILYHNINKISKSVKHLNAALEISKDERRKNHIKKLLQV